jgi:hypothetical protein
MSISFVLCLSHLTGVYCQYQRNVTFKLVLVILIYVINYNNTFNILHKATVKYTLLIMKSNLTIHK